jgi:thiamine biosynthesis lipoprotein
MGSAPGTVRVEHVMGMPITIDVRDAAVPGTALDDVYAWLRRVDAVFSTHRGDSEISRLNRGDLDLASTDPDVREVLGLCDLMRDVTGGWFDAWAAPSPGVDPAGLVKGWSVDRAARILDAAGCANYAINAGGDIRLRGGALPERAWRVGIQHPGIRDRVAAIVGGTDLAIATSGAYARGDHVLDPFTRRPPVGLLSVTVTGPDLATADAFATAAFAMGHAGTEWLRTLPGRGYEALAIGAGHRVLSTPGLPLAA